MGEMEERKEKPTIRKCKKIWVGGGIVICIFILFFCSYYLLQGMGKKSLGNHGGKLTSENSLSEVSELQQEESPYELKEGQILLEGQVYEYNQDIITFLCLGVDSHSGIAKTKTPGEAGQADALILVVMNPKTEEIRLININRDSMVEIETYDTAGVYAGKEFGQITLQYAYGDGREKSCELMEKAVSDLFYQIPIHGYVAMDIGAIAALNDAVGGVEVTVTEDVAVYMPQWNVGSKVILQGEEALYFVRHRAAESKELGTNVRRIERQKEFMAGFLQKAREKAKGDISFLLSLYGKIQKHLITSISLDEMMYLTQLVFQCDFSLDSMIGMSGEQVMGEKNEEFHVDNKALKQMVIDVFYEKVESK